MSKQMPAPFATVTPVLYKPAIVPTVTLTRLNDRYRPAIALARLILQNSTLELGRGETPGVAFLVDMNKVFEDFVVIALRERLRLTDRELRRGHDSYLDEAGIIKVKPDLSWYIGNRLAFVGDVKYKRVHVEGVENPDLYQLLAYTIAADLPGGLLIYPADEGKGTSHQVVHIEETLHVVTLKVGGDPASFLSEIARVSDIVRSLATPLAHA